MATKARIKKILKKAGLVSSIVVVNEILQSFGNPVFAECSGNSGGTNVCVTAADVCVPDSSTVTFTADGIEPYPFTVSGDEYSDNVYPVHVIADEATGTVKFTPSEQYYNNFSAEDFNEYYIYKSLNPNDGTIVNFEFTMITPEVAANEGPIEEGNGRMIYYAQITGTAFQWTGWDMAYYDDEQYTVNFAIIVDHANRAPVISHTSNELTWNSDKTSVVDAEVFAIIHDTESNNVDVLIELSSNPEFTDIREVAEYNLTATPAGVPISHKFVGVNLYTFYWRVSATETNAIGYCSDAQLASQIKTASNSTTQTPTIPVNPPTTSSSSSSVVTRLPSTAMPFDPVPSFLGFITLAVGVAMMIFNRKKNY